MTNRHFYIFFILLGLFTSLTFPASAQDRPTEEQVETEKLFIDASKEKVLGNYEDAAFLFKEVLKRDKRNHAAAYELARLYDVLDKVDKAQASIKMAIAGDANNQWYRMFLADVYDRLGKFKDGAKIYGSLRKEKPYNEYFYIKQAFLLIKAKKSEDAVEVYHALEQKIGISEEISQKKVRLYLGLGQPEQAVETYQLLVKSDPYNLDYHHLLAGLYLQLGNEEAAAQSYLRILEIDPNNAIASIALAEREKVEGDDASFLNSLTPVFEKPDVDIDVKVKEILPYLHKMVATPDEPTTNTLLKLAAILEKQHPDEAKAYAVYGDILYYSDRKTPALQKYMKARSLNNTIYSIYEQIMYINLETNSYDSLLIVSNEAIDLFPNQAGAYYFNGIALGFQQKEKEAINAYNQALLMSRKNPQLQFDLYSRMGGLYHRLGKFALSDKNMEKALQLNPKDYNLLNNYSFYLTERGEQLEKAKGMSSLANELKPNQAQFQDTYGWILYQMKEYEGAKEWLSKAIDNGGINNASILEHYGDVLYQLGKTDAAIAEWQKALDKKGGTDDTLEEKIRRRQL